MFPKISVLRCCIFLSSFLMFFSVSMNAFAELSDPTRPTKPSETLFSDSGGEGSMQLDAIFYTAGNPIVVIGGTILHLNDSIGGYTLTQVHPQSVELTSTKGEKINLNLDALEIKKPHA